jgi:hypothetical protein
VTDDVNKGGETVVLSHTLSHTVPLADGATDWSAALIVELLRAGEAATFVARGRSMWPSITSGSRIEVMPCLLAQLAVGDVAAFERKGGIVIHRIRAIEPGQVLFGGDAAAGDDGWVSASRLLGRARVLTRRRLQPRCPTLTDVALAWRAFKRRLTLLSS